MINRIRTARRVRRLTRTLAPYTVTPAQASAWDNFETARADYADRVASRTGAVILAPRAYRISGRV